MASLSRNERLALRQTVAGSLAGASRETSEWSAPGQTVAGSLAWSYGEARGSLADWKQGDCRPGAHPTGAWSRDGPGAKF